MATAELWSWLPRIVSTGQAGPAWSWYCAVLPGAVEGPPRQGLSPSVIALFVFLLITNKGLEVLSLCATLKLLV